MKACIMAGTLALALALGGCGILPHNTVKLPSENGHPLVNMSSSIFLGARTLTIKAGQSISFREPTTGGVHVLLAGTHGTSHPQAGAPAALNSPNGVPVHAGQDQRITFTQPGVYHITTLYHDAMQLTVVVKK